LIIEIFDACRHNISAFECGRSSLDLGVRDDPVQFGKAFVVVPKHGERDILAIFAFLPEPGELVSQAGAEAPWTSIWLNPLSVSQKHQRRGIGRWVLSQIIEEMVAVSNSSRLDFLVVQPLDDISRDYFLHINLGFIPIPQSDNLILYVDTMKLAMQSHSRRKKRIFT
jgi:GNAT superfamily N-acetyltransferase